MSLENKILAISSKIIRAKRTPAGMIVEVSFENVREEHRQSLIDEIGNKSWEDGEIVYALHTFTNDNDRFTVEAILRETRTKREFNMSSSVAGPNDVYCKFSPYDFDVLTLSDRDETTVGLFVLEDFSSTPSIVFKELDILGHQFIISSKAKKVRNHYEIVLACDELRDL